MWQMSRNQPALVPQLAQNFAPAGSSFPHSVQCLTAGAIGGPQFMQNFAPAGCGVAHDAQAGPAAAVGGAAAGAGGACGAGRGCCCCIAPAIIPGSPKPAARKGPSVAPPPCDMPCPAPSAISPAAYCWNPPASWE